MATVRFQAGDVDLVLSGTEGFVTRQLLMLSPFLGEVDGEALRQAEAQATTASESREVEPVEAQPLESESVEEGAPAGNGTVEKESPAEPEPEQEEVDGLRRFYLENQPKGRDAQTDAALLLAYYLERFEGRKTIRMGDLVHSCIRAGVDTRNLNRPLGILTRRGLLESVAGNTYRISSQGVQAVESRL